MAQPRPAVKLYSQYDDAERSKRVIAKGGHRNLVGAFWDEIGQLQLDFLIGMGLKPEHRLLDIGCGCLRAGVKIIPFLDPQHYYGIDAEKRLLDVGYGKELAAAGLQGRMARANLFCSRLFHHQRLAEDSIDMGICVSVMTHLPLNFLRLCLDNAGLYFKPGARLYLTFFEVPEGSEFSKPYKNAKGITTVGFKDPYHYYASDMLAMAQGTAWTGRYIGEWNHPRGQMMMEYAKR